MIILGDDPDLPVNLVYLKSFDIGFVIKGENIKAVSFNAAMACIDIIPGKKVYPYHGIPNHLGCENIIFWIAEKEFLKSRKGFSAVIGRKPLLAFTGRDF